MKQTVFKKLRLIGTHISLPLLLLCMSAQNVSAQIDKTWKVVNLYKMSSSEYTMSKDATPTPIACQDDNGKTILTVNFMKDTWHADPGRFFQNPDGIDYDDKDAYVKAKSNPGCDGEQKKIGCDLLPNEGACYTFTPTYDGYITVSGILSYKTNSEKYFYVVSESDHQPVKNAILMYNQKQMSFNEKNGAFLLPEGSGSGQDSYLPCSVKIPVQANQTYYVFTKAAEGLLFSQFTYTTTFDISDNTPIPYLHKKVSMYGCTMMFGGYLSADADKTAATDQPTESSFANETHKDKWTKAKVGNLYYIKGTGNAPYRESFGGKHIGNGYATAPSLFDDLPCYGTFYKFNPTCDGTLKVGLYNDGTSWDEPKNESAAPDKYCYFIDETGTPMAPNGITISKGVFEVAKGATDSYLFDVKAGKTYFLFCDEDEIGFRGFDYTPASTSATDVTVSDGDKTAPSSVSNANVQLKRSYLSGWNTICLPFSMSQDMVRSVFGSDAELVAFTQTIQGGGTELSDRIVHFTKHYYQNIVAGKPYMIYLPNGANTSLNVPYATIDANVKAKTDYDGEGYYDFVGVYNGLNIPTNDYYLNASGLFSRKSESKSNIVYMKGLRAYFNSQNEGGVIHSQGAKAVDIDTDEDELTHIIEVEGVEDNTETTSGVYNMNGSKVADGLNNAHLPKGVYIVNGKKIVFN